MSSTLRNMDTNIDTRERMPDAWQRPLSERERYAIFAGVWPLNKDGLPRGIRLIDKAESGFEMHIERVFEPDREYCARCGTDTDDDLNLWDHKCDEQEANL